MDTPTDPALDAHAVNRRRWIALIIVCFAQLMIVLDTTIVNIALRPIQRSLHFSAGNLTWVVTAYLISFGSTLLLAGRLGDLFGRKRIFLAGLTLFTLASLWCGLAQSSAVLVAGRFVQGIGGGMASSVILAIIVTEFSDEHDRARAMGVFTFVAVSGGSIGLLLGGVITQALSWHWIFFINIPIGIATVALGRSRIDETEMLGAGDGVDYVGAVLVTAGTMLGVYAIVGATKDGWTSATTLGFGGVSLALLTAFVFWEDHVHNPLIPLRVLRSRNLVGSAIARGLLVTGMFSVFFLGALYLEHVRGYSATQTGLAFLPMTIVVGALSLRGTPELIRRFGPLRVLICGLALDSVALFMLTRAGAHTAYAPYLLVAFSLLAVGQGTSFMPLVVVAMDGVPKSDAGLASGFVNVSMQLFGALGLAVLSTLSTTRAATLRHSGHSQVDSLVGGFHLAYTVGALCVVAALVISITVLRPVGARARERAEPVLDAAG